MGISARQIVRWAAGDLNVFGLGDSMSAEYAEDGRRMLNNMVSGWRTQFGTVVAVERTIFPVVANKQTYTIGLGGDFNVPRPVTVVGAGLWLNGLGAASSLTSITRSGYTATVTQTSHGFAVGDEAYIDGADQIGYNGLQTVQTVPDANTFTYTLDSRPATPATGTLTVASVQGQPVEIPRFVISDDAYQAIQIKNLANAQFTLVYYNPTPTPYGTVFLWPKPNTAQNQLVLYLQNVFGGFDSLDAEYDWPDLPGYAEALEYNLCKRLASADGRTVPDEIQDLARTSLGLIKRANNKLTDLPSDANLLTYNRRGQYNIQTDQGGSA